MKYEVIIEMMYLAGRESLPEDARAALASSTFSILAALDDGRVTVVSLDVLADIDGRTRVIVVLAGTGPADLTSPVEAVMRVDAGMLRALMRGGMFEEFDVASRTLSVRPSRRSA